MKKDFVTWLRMFLIFMIAGGITIQAVLYPNYYPLDESIIMALSRAFFGMFLTKIDDLDSEFYSCMYYSQYSSVKNICFCKSVCPRSLECQNIFSLPLVNFVSYLIQSVLMDYRCAHSHKSSF